MLAVVARRCRERVLRVVVRRRVCQVLAVAVRRCRAEWLRRLGCHRRVAVVRRLRRARQCRRTWYRAQAGRVAPVLEVPCRRVVRRCRRTWFPARVDQVAPDRCLRADLPCRRIWCRVQLDLVVREFLGLVDLREHLVRPECLASADRLVVPVRPVCPALVDRRRVLREFLAQPPLALPQVLPRFREVLARQASPAVPALLDFLALEGPAPPVSQARVDQVDQVLLVSLVAPATAPVTRRHQNRQRLAISFNSPSPMAVTKTPSS